MGATPVTVRLPPPTLAVVDAWAAKKGVTRPAAIRAMIEAMVALGGLDDAPEPKRREKGQAQFRARRPPKRRVSC